MRFDFYSLSRWSLEDAIPRILDKIIEKDNRALILTSSEEEAEELCESLWSTSINKWLGHGTIKDGNPLDQRVFITNEIGKDMQRTAKAAYLYYGLMINSWTYELMMI